MKRQQYLLAGAGVFLLLTLYFFGQTIPPHPKPEAPAQGSEGASVGKSIGLQEILQATKSRLSPSQLSYVNRLEHSVVRGDVRSQELNAYRELAGFWRDSVGNG